MAENSMSAFTGQPYIHIYFELCHQKSYNEILWGEMFLTIHNSENTLENQNNQYPIFGSTHARAYTETPRSPALNYSIGMHHAQRIVQQKVDDDDDAARVPRALVSSLAAATARSRKD